MSTGHKIFILPTVTIKQINSICRAFLWTGQCYSSMSGYVSWEEVCKPRIHGGLGFRSLATWNYAIVGKQAWSIAMREDNLWVRWIHTRYMKQNYWATFQVSVGMAG